MIAGLKPYPAMKDTSKTPGGARLGETAEVANG